MKTLFYLSKKKINKKGFAPIYCRITVHGRRSEVSTGIFIKPLQWLNEGLIETDPENIVVNSALSKIKSDISFLYYDLTFKGKCVSAEILRDLYTGNSKYQYTFIELIEEYIDYKQKTITEYNTLKTYRSRKALIISFLTHINRKNLLPEEFNIRLCENFMQHLAKNKLSKNYINREIVFLKAILNYGIRIEILTINPILAIQLKHEKPKPIISLSKAELLKLATYKFASEKLQHVSDLYIFQSFTGFSYADLCDFNFSKHVKKIKGKQWILKPRVKSDIEATLPLFNDAKRILKRYHNNLPVISNQKYNTYLKEIIAVLGIKKELTTHTARKTFAMIKLNDGFSIESVAKMLGHNNIEVTQSTYTQINTSRIEAEQIRLGIK